MKCFLKRFFNKEKSISETTSMPEWNKIVIIMYDKNLAFYNDEIIKVIYSDDKSKRYLITKNPEGFFRYSFQTIIQFDEYEWQYICNDENALPAMWVSSVDDKHNSIFASEAMALKELQAEPNYRQFFACSLSNE